MAVPIPVTIRAMISGGIGTLATRRGGFTLHDACSPKCQSVTAPKNLRPVRPGTRTGVCSIQTSYNLIAHQLPAYTPCPVIDALATLQNFEAHLQRRKFDAPVVPQKSHTAS